VKYNDALAAWATKANSPELKITVADCYTGFNVKTDTQDGVHPNESTGSTKMANCFFEPLVAAIKSSK
jgi:hypothetical protein